MDLPTTTKLNTTPIVRRTRIDRSGLDGYMVTWIHGDSMTRFECATRYTARNLAAVLDDPNVLRIL